MEESNRMPEEGKNESEISSSMVQFGSSAAVTSVTTAAPDAQASQVAEKTEQVTESQPNAPLAMQKPTQQDNEAAPEAMATGGQQNLPSHSLQGFSSPPTAPEIDASKTSTTRSSSGHRDDSSLDSAHNPDDDEEEEQPPEEFATAEAARLYQERVKQKREKRLAMNRASARERRRRKKLLIDSLQKQVEVLEDKVEELQGANARLRDYVGRLEIELARAQNTLATTKGQAVQSLQSTQSNPNTTTQTGLSVGLSNTPLGASLAASASRQPGLNHQASLFGQHQQTQQQQSSAMNQRGGSSASMGMVVSQRADEALQSLIEAQQRKQQQEQQAATAAALRNQVGGASAASLLSHQQYQSPLGLGNDPRLLDTNALAREEAREAALLQQQQQREALLMQQLAAGQNFSLGQDISSLQAQLQSQQQQQPQQQSSMNLADQILLARQHGLLGGTNADQLATNAVRHTRHFLRKISCLWFQQNVPPRYHPNFKLTMPLLCFLVVQFFNSAHGGFRQSLSAILRFSPSCTARRR
jgi:hypothetical protein